MPPTDQEDPIAIFSMPRRSKKDASDKAQEEEDNDDIERNRGSVFASIVQRAKIQKAKEEQEEQEMEEKSSLAVEQSSGEAQSGAQDGIELRSDPGEHGGALLLNGVERQVGRRAREDLHALAAQVGVLALKPLTTRLHHPQARELGRAVA